MPSAPNEIQRRSSERSFIHIIVLARTGRQLSVKQWCRLLSLVIRFTNISLPVCFLKHEHIVRNLLVYVKTFFHKFLK